MDTFIACIVRYIHLMTQVDTNNNCFCYLLNIKKNRTTFMSICVTNCRVDKKYVFNMF